MPKNVLSLATARRMALAAQGFDRPRPEGRVDARHLRRLIHQLGLLQLDYVNVLLPAHYQVPFSRLGAYDRSRLDDLVYRRREFTEQWAHEASLVPMASWPLLRHRMEVHRARPWHFGDFLDAHPEYVAWILEEVRTRGPLTPDQLPHPEGTSRRIDHSWFSSVPRGVLEAHFGRGQLAIASRLPNFARVYDLAERIVPAEHLERRVDREEAQRQLLLQAARACAVATAADLSDYFRMYVKEARPRLDELVEAGQLQLVQVEGWRELAYLHPEARAPRRIQAATLLSPFDPLIWYRPRTARLFDFDFRFEIFVPEEKRKWGTYVLPFLLGDRLVARVDLKAERAERRLRIAASWREEHTDDEAVASALAAELRILAAWLDLEAITLDPKGDFHAPLAAALGTS